MNIIKALNNKSGVENLGVQIQPDDETIEPMANVVFVGIFKRGRVDQPFQVTEANYRAVLGYDPRNKVFQAIEDAFKTGISSVWVQRVSNNAPWRDWVLNPGVSITGMMARYTGYKTNGYKYFDSFANVDLTDAIIQSFHDADMQQWQGFKDAVNELTGVTDWIVDAANNQIVYQTLPPENCNSNGSGCPTVEYVYRLDSIYYSSGDAACKNVDVSIGFGKIPPTVKYEPNYCKLYGGSNNYNGNIQAVVNPVKNPAYNPEIENKNTLPLDTVVTQKIISNLQSSNEGTSLLAEAYLEAVANSIFNQDESKQFLKLTDLIAQFEVNKIART